MAGHMSSTAHPSTRQMIAHWCLGQASDQRLCNSGQSCQKMQISEAASTRDSHADDGAATVAMCPGSASTVG